MRSDESGLAFMEFLVAMPFLIVMTLALFDCGRALNAYLVISQVVHEGVRQGSSEFNLENGTFELASAPSAACNSGVILNAGQLSKQAALQEKTKRLLELQGLSININNLCIESGRTLPTHTADSRPGDTVYVRIKTNYDGIFPMFRNLPIQVNATGPYLFAADSSSWNL